MKVDWPPARSSRRADAREDAVDHADARRCLAGTNAADLRHERDERDLTHVGRLTGHVGAGDDGGAVLALAHIGVVRDEERVLEHALDDGVAAVVNFDDAAVVHARTAIVVVHRDRTRSEQSVSSSAMSPAARWMRTLSAVTDLAQGGETFQIRAPCRDLLAVRISCSRFLSSSVM